MLERDFRNSLFLAYIKGFESESHWGFKFDKLPYVGKMVRMRLFLRWYNANFNKQ